MTNLHGSLYQVPLSLQNESESSFWQYHTTDNSYSFELIDMSFWRDTLIRHRALAFYAAAVYIITIFGLEKYMRNRQAFDLKTPLILWNAGLGIFSIIGFTRTAPVMAKYMTGFDGIYRSICVRDYPEPPMIFWGLAFSISKYVELGDTLFIVLRKRPLQLLQWYHHIATLIVVWITLPYVEPIGRWFVVLNYLIHAAMYPYFALKMAGVDIPKMISNLITTAQFAQMLIGFLLNVVTIGSIAAGSSCYRTPISIWAFLAVYGTFVVLFGKLFRDAVLKSTKERKQEKRKKAI